MNVGFNTIKITVATVVAILVAQGLELEFAVSAGIVAILSIAPTKKETIRTASHRFYAFIMALLIAFLSFSLLGYNLMGFTMYILIFIFACQYMGWTSAMAMDSVLVSHFLTFGAMDMASISNEVLLFLVGTCCGLIANMHLKQNTHYMEKMKVETDQLIKESLYRMSQRIVDNQLENYNGECFEKLNQSIRAAKDIAKLNYMNQLDEMNTIDMEYIAMRQKQVFVLQNMYKKVSVLKTTPLTAEKISNYLKNVSDNFNDDALLDFTILEFKTMNEEFKLSPLPAKRKEFEDRAHLFTLLQDMEEFIGLKVEYLKLTNKRH